MLNEGSISPDTLNLRDKPVILIHHAGQHAGHAPPGSLSALEGCLNTGAAVIEIDVVPLADGSFALLHEQDLALETDGTGKAPQMSRTQVQNLHYRLDGKVSAEKVGFLDGAVDLLAAHPQTQRLQLDLKPFSPLKPSILQDLLALIAPVQARIQITSVADWVIRDLRQANPGLSLGFDPLLYLDRVEDEPRPKEIPPFRVGAYGLLDDHPLSAYQWGSMGAYLAARAAALLVQVPEGCQWFIRAALLKAVLDAGFDWIEFLHQNGASVDGWTIDVDQPDQIDLARVLVAKGVDALTTDAPPRLAAHLAVETIV